MANPSLTRAISYHYSLYKSMGTAYNLDIVTRPGTYFGDPASFEYSIECTITGQLRSIEPQRFAVRLFIFCVVGRAPVNLVPVYPRHYLCPDGRQRILFSTIGNNQKANYAQGTRLAPYDQDI